MGSTSIQNGQTARIEITAFDGAGDPVTGLTDVLVLIRRVSDGFYLDFDDNTFKDSGWTDIDQVMSEVNAVHSAGEYLYDFDTTGFADDIYEFRSTCASATNFPQVGELTVDDFIIDQINRVLTDLEKIDPLLFGIEALTANLVILRATLQA